MNSKNSHCGYCGAPFSAGLPWPRECHRCGNRSYLNPLPVVVLLVPAGEGLVVIRRGIEPCRGTLTLPGGYLDLDESWQEGAQRELLEETGIEVDAQEIGLYEVMNGLDGTLIIFGLAAPQQVEAVKPFLSGETEEVLVIDRPIELGFEMHTKVVARYFAEKTKKINRDEGDTGDKNLKSKS